MPTKTATWTQLEYFPATGISIWGLDFVGEMDCDVVLLSSQSHWLRTAVDDVINSLPESENASFEAGSVKIYRKLKTIWPKRGFWANFCFWRKAPEKPRRGLVSTRQPITIYLSQKGLQTPSVVFEEVAHATTILVPSDHDYPAGRADPSFILFLTNLVERLGYRPEKVKWFIKCHWLIFRSFLNQSDALASTLDVTERVRIESAHSLCESNCRILFLNSDNGKCRCYLGEKHD